MFSKVCLMVDSTSAWIGGLHPPPPLQSQKFETDGMKASVGPLGVIVGALHTSTSSPG